MSYPKHIDPVEARIISALIDAVLSRGYEISIYDGEEMALTRSTDRSKIQAEVAATDLTYLWFSRRGIMKGYILCVHGNGEDVLSDGTDNKETQELFKAVEALVS